MKKELKILKKIESALKQLNCREFLHHFGPKKFKLKQHLLALLLMQAYKLSLRRVENLMKMFGIKSPTYSALCKSRKRIPSWIWNKLLLTTAGLHHKTVAIDGTGFARTNPSQHYIKRIDIRNPVKNFAKFSMLYDIDSHTVIAVCINEKRTHDMKDAKPLLRSYCRMQCLLADKGYDAEWLHQYCFERNVKTVIPRRKTTRKGFYRRKQAVNYSEDKYHQRSNIESGFSAIKRKYGSSVSGKGLRALRAELSCKALAYNLRLCC